jgi:hypothetical protein
MSVKGLRDWTSIAGDNVVVNSVSLPIIITLHCEDILELYNEFLQPVPFSGAQDWPRAEYKPLQLLTQPLCP